MGLDSRPVGVAAAKKSCKIKVYKSLIFESNWLFARKMRGFAADIRQTAASYCLNLDGPLHTTALAPAETNAPMASRWAESFQLIVFPAPLRGKRIGLETPWSIATPSMPPLTCSKTCAS
jgi:hypothetical protein